MTPMTWVDYVFAGMLLLMPPFFTIAGALAAWSKTAPWPPRAFLMLNGAFGALVMWVVNSDALSLNVGWELKAVYSFAAAISVGLVLWRVVVIFLEVVSAPNEGDQSASERV